MLFYTSVQQTLINEQGASAKVLTPGVQCTPADNQLCGGHPLSIFPRMGRMRTASFFPRECSVKMDNSVQCQWVNLSRVLFVFMIIVAPTINAGRVTLYRERSVLNVAVVLKGLIWLWWRETSCWVDLAKRPILFGWSALFDVSLFFFSSLLPLLGKCLSKRGKGKPKSWM